MIPCGVARTCAALLLLASMGAAAADVTAKDLQQRVGVDPHVGGKVPLEAAFHDERGASRTLGELMAGRPTILAMVYFDCPNLCSVTLSALSRSLAQANLDPTMDYRVIAISIDPREGPRLAAARQAGHLAAFGAGSSACTACASRWHFLTGTETSIHRIAQALGYRYFWDAHEAQYAHPAGAVVLSGAGRIARYLNGVEFPTTELRQALGRAAAGRTDGESVADRFWLLCYHYEALAGRYGGDITLALRVLGLASVAGLALLLLRITRIRG